MKKKVPDIFAFCVSMLFLQACQKDITSDKGSVALTFRNVVGNSAMELNSVVYNNPFNEQYTITKFRYYISNVKLTGDGGIVAVEPNSYHLVDEANPGSLRFNFDVAVNSFSKMEFVLGVDSTRNVSGAQTGALDPLNDMFWTWNSGYVMAKLEGNSPQSTVAGNKIEYHIGGFSGENNVLKHIQLTFPDGKQVNVKAGQTSKIMVEADVNTWWQAPNNIRIAELPICTTPGVPSKKIAENYGKMFTITDVINE